MAFQHGRAKLAVMGLEEESSRLEVLLFGEGNWRERREISSQKAWDWEKGLCSCAGYFSHPRAQQMEFVIQKDVSAVPQNSSPHSLKHASPYPPPLTSKNCYDLKYFLIDGLPGVMFQCFLLKKMICDAAYLNSDSAPPCSAASLFPICRVGNPLLFNIPQP